MIIIQMSIDIECNSHMDYDYFFKINFLSYTKNELNKIKKVLESKHDN